jgi:hypothetical protein
LWARLEPTARVEPHMGLDYVRLNLSSQMLD